MTELKSEQMTSNSNFNIWDRALGSRVEAPNPWGRHRRIFYSQKRKRKNIGEYSTRRTYSTVYVNAKIVRIFYYGPMAIFL